MILIQDETIERNANGKIVKTELRKRVRAEWARRVEMQKTMRSHDHSVKGDGSGKVRARAKL